MPRIGSRGVGAAVALVALLGGHPARALRYRIDTFAGGGTDRPATGKGVPAAAVALRRPSGLARSARGDVFIAVHDDARVLRVRGGRGGRVVVPFAGTGTPGWTGDGGPALAAELLLPTGLSTMPGGDLLIADAGSDGGGNAVRRIDRRGIIHAFAGVADGAPGDGGDGGPAVAALLHTPLRTAITRARDVYIVELNNHRVRVVGADGRIRPFAGTGVPGDAGDGGAAVEAQLRNPAGVALGPHGVLYVADFGNDRLRVVTPDGMIQALAGTGVPTGSIDGEGGDPRDDRNDGPASAATFSKPTGIAVDRQGGLLVVDQGNNLVRRVAPGSGGGLGPDSIVTTLVGDGRAAFAGDGGDALRASLAGPTDVLALGRGRFLIADRGNDRVRLAVPVGR